jgi:hypothetical protein
LLGDLLEFNMITPGDRIMITMSVSALRRQIEKSGDSDGVLAVPIELGRGLARSEACSPRLRGDGKWRSLARADPT